MEVVSEGQSTARVVAFVPDLLFGSRVQTALQAVSYAVELVGDGDRLRGAVPGAKALVVDLTADVEARVELVRSLDRGGTRALAFYSHVETDTRALAEDAGFDLVVPRSRMAREGAELIARLLSDD